jgi:hypothetical protein
MAAPLRLLRPTAARALGALSREAVPLRAGWWRRVTTGRLFVALLAAAGGAWAFGSVAGALEII